MATPPLDHHRLLGVPRGASPEEIASAYRMRVQVCHPDRLAGSPEAVVRAANDLMSLLNEARAALSEPVAEAPPQEPRYVPLRVVPEVVRIADVVPGTPVVAMVRIESPEPQRAAPRVRASDPAIVTETDVLHGSSRRAQVRLRIHTNLLAEHKRYQMELAADWGTAVGILTLDLTTTELRTWDDDDQLARRRHPSSRSRRAPGRNRRRDLTGWAIAGFLLPVVAISWARGHLPMTVPAASGWVQLAGMSVVAAGLYPLWATRGFGRVTVLRRGPGEAGMAVVRAGTAIAWAGRAVGRGLVRAARWGRHAIPAPRGRVRIR